MVMGAAGSKNFLSSKHDEVNINIVHHHPKHDLEGIRSHEQTKLLRASPETTVVLVKSSDIGITGGSPHEEEVNQSEGQRH